MVEIRFFGQLTDIVRTEKVLIESVSDTDMVRKKIVEMYPLLATATFKIALNNKLVIENTVVAENSIIAFMPPFSGG
jgi:molybdopterin synthase sulfur carrier subunit